MASFTIPSGFGGLIAPKTIYFDNALPISKERKVRKMKFGDGFKSIIPISAPKRNMQFQMVNRPPEDINLVESYIIFLAGQPLPDLTTMGQTWSGKIKAFSKMYSNGEVYGLSGVIEEL